MLPYEMGESAFKYYGPTIRELFQMGQVRNVESDQEISSPAHVRSQTSGLNSFSSIGQVKSSPWTQSRLSAFAQVETVGQLKPPPNIQHRLSRPNLAQTLGQAPSPPRLQSQTPILRTAEQRSSPLLINSAPQTHSQTLTDDSSDYRFGQRLARVGFPEVFYRPSWDLKENVINLGNRYRMMLHAIQREIVDEVATIQHTRVVEKTKFEGSEGHWKIMVCLIFERSQKLPNVPASFFYTGLGAHGRIFSKGRAQR